VGRLTEDRPWFSYSKFTHRPPDGDTPFWVGCGAVLGPGRHPLFNHLRRRELITLLAGTAATWPLAARAQQPASIPRIGIIDDSPRWNVFRNSLRDLGHLEGQNIAFEYRYGDGVPERLAEAATQLVRRPVDVIATYGTAASFAAKQATTTIPIVMISVGDPVRAGLVASLARPGGNITGNTILGPDIGAKRMQLIKEAIPTLSRVAFLWNPNNGSHAAYRQELQVAAPALSIKLIFVEVGNSNELDSAFAAMMREHPDAFSMTGDPFHQLHLGWIIDFMARNRLPAVYQLSENVHAGGLMSYGASQPDLFRRAAGYVHKILQGTKPADLPVEQPTKFELVINLKTAKAIGLTIPESFLLRADEVIE
jgi:putative ABC transport system substrate-binding protein